MMERFVIAGIWREEVWPLGVVTYNPETCTPEDVYETIAKGLRAQADDFEFAAITGRYKNDDGTETDPAGGSPDHG